MSDYIDYSDRKVAGYCPMGCGQTLFMGSYGHVTCSYIPCPRPDAADAILADHEPGHIMVTDDFDYNMIHPLRERLDQELLDCELSRYLRSMSGSPVVPGRYLVTGSGVHWEWKPLPTT